MSFEIASIEVPLYLRSISNDAGMSSPIVNDMAKIVSACDERAARDFISQHYIDLPLAYQDHLAFAFFKAARDGSSSTPDETVNACELLTFICSQLQRASS